MHMRPGAVVLLSVFCGLSMVDEQYGGIVIEEMLVRLPVVHSHAT